MLIFLTPGHNIYKCKIKQRNASGKSQPLMIYLNFRVQFTLSLAYLETRLIQSFKGVLLLDTFNMVGCYNTLGFHPGNSTMTVKAKKIMSCEIRIH